MGAFDSSAPMRAHDSIAVAPMSQQLWGIEWAAQLPFESGGFHVELSNHARAKLFVAANYATVFEEDATTSPFATDLSAAKNRYYRTFGDFFEFFHGEELAGLLIC